MESGSTGHIRLTDAGITAAGGFEVTPPPRTNAEYKDYIKTRLTKPKAPEVFDILYDGQPRTVYCLVKEVGYSRPSAPSFFYPFQELRRKKLVEKAGTVDRRGLWHLVDSCFPEGRPAGATPIDTADEVKPPRKKLKKDHNIEMGEIKKKPVEAEKPVRDEKEEEWEEETEKTKEVQGDKEEGEIEKDEAVDGEDVEISKEVQGN